MIGGGGQRLGLSPLPRQPSAKTGIRVHIHVTGSQVEPSLWHVLSGLSGSADKGPKEAPDPPPTPQSWPGILSPLPSPTKGIWKRWEDPLHQNHFPFLCPPGPSQPGHQLTRTLHPLWEEEGAWKARAPPKCLERGHLPCPARGSLEKHLSQESDLWGSLGIGCV